MEILAIILSSLLGVFGTLAFMFWKAYSSKKAENVATIEDTETITKIQEAVRHTFQQELAKIQLENQNKISLTTEHRNAIFNYNDSLYEYYNFTLNRMDFQGSPFSDEYYNLSLKYKLSRERLNLFFSDSTFETLEDSVDSRIRDIFTSISNYQYHINELSTLRKLIDSEHQEEGRETNIKSLEQKRQDLSEAHQRDVYKKLNTIDEDLIDLRRVLKSYIDRIYQS